MKLITYPAAAALGLLALSVVSASPTPQSDAPWWEPSSPSPPFTASGGSYAKPVGRLLDLAGRVGYFAGSNAWWLGYLEASSDVDLVLSELANSGIKTLRIWGFNDLSEIPSGTTGPSSTWYQVLNSTGQYINYGYNGLQRLDTAVRMAEQHGIALIIPFVDNWGGYETYNEAFGGNTSTWYTTPACQSAYKNWVKTLVTRYSQSTAIFAWELANEPRCTYADNSGCPTSVITEWATEISQYIKSLDPNHMVILGDEGWFAPADGIGDGSYAYSGDQGIDFVENLKIPTLDYGVFHLYPDSWGYDYTWGSTWIVEHDAVGKAIGKPIILEEYGTPFPHNHTGTEGPWQQTVLKNTSLASDSFWQFAPYGQEVPYADIIDVNSIFYNDTEYVPLVRVHAAEMLAKAPETDQ